MISARVESVRVAWRQLAPRERRLIAGGIALVAATAIYLLVLSPFYGSLKKLRAEVPQERSQLAVMREQAALVARLRRESPGRTQPAKLTALVGQSAAAHGLTSEITRLELEGSGGVRVVLEGGSFNALIAMLAELQQRAGLRVETAALESHTATGAVSGRLLLRAPGS